MAPALGDKIKRPGSTVWGGGGGGRSFKLSNDYVSDHEYKLCVILQTMRVTFIHYCLCTIGRHFLGQTSVAFPVCVHSSSFGCSYHASDFPLHYTLSNLVRYTTWALLHGMPHVALGGFAFLCAQMWYSEHYVSTRMCVHLYGTQ